MRNYLAIIERTTGTTTDATARIIAADSITTAHKDSYIVACKASGDDVTIYPALYDDGGKIDSDGIVYGAAMVARRTIANACMFGGGGTAYSADATAADIAKAQRRAHSIAKSVAAYVIKRNYTMLSELNQLNHKPTAAAILTANASMTADTQDYLSIAMNTLYDGATAYSGNDDDGGKATAQCYHDAFGALNDYNKAQRKASKYELSTEFIRDGGGDLVSYNKAIAAIIRGGDSWTPASGDGMDSATAARLGNAIAAAAATLTPTQRHVAELLGEGYSQAKIAEKTNRTQRTVEKNVAIVRDAMAKAMQGGEFESMIDSAKAAASAKAVRNNSGKKRTADGIARKKDSDRRTQAARAKAYRERKKAAAAIRAGEKQ